ncbi:MAG: lipopolysaccharide heptosyltransferase II [Candidatus Delongbacteria bacterium]|jgi:heptosyltransferase-2|nr:lipopolysaccharide heptosyltransferase II [Candidatus Delongbacteria bacterium]
MNYKKILVIQTAFLGDAILTTPMLKGLKDIFPDSKIDILCLPQTKLVFENNPNIDDLIIFDKRNKTKKFISFIKSIINIRKNEYDLGISIQSSFTSSLLMNLGNIKTKHGFSRQKLIDMSVNHAEIKGAHKIDKILRLLEPFSNNKFDRQTELYYSEEDKIFVENKIGDIENFKGKIIGIAPGSVWFTKKWPKEYFTTLVKELTENNFKVYLLGGPEDFNLCEEIARDTTAVNLAGKLTILQSAAAIEKCDLMVTNDSAPLHIANAVKTDVIAIFGPTVKSLGFYPYRENDIVIELDMDCRPCGKHGGNKCPLGHHNCMKNITPQMVLDVILNKIG